MVASRIKEEAQEIKRTTATAIAAAFGFVIAFFWNEAVKSSIETFLAALDITGQTYIYKILAAVIVTIVAVFAIRQVSKWSAAPAKPN